MQNARASRANGGQSRNGGGRLARPSRRVSGLGHRLHLPRTMFARRHRHRREREVGQDPNPSARTDTAFASRPTRGFITSWRSFDPCCATRFPTGTSRRSSPGRSAGSSNKSASRRSARARPRALLEEQAGSLLQRAAFPPHPGIHPASRLVEGRRPLPLRVHGWPTVRLPRVPGVPPRGAVGPLRGALHFQHPTTLSRSQPVRGRAGLRSRAHGCLPLARAGPCLRCERVANP